MPEVIVLKDFNNYLPKKTASVAETFYKKVSKVYELQQI